MREEPSNRGSIQESHIEKNTLNGLDTRDLAGRHNCAYAPDKNLEIYNEELMLMPPGKS